MEYTEYKGPRSHDTHTKFHKDCFSSSKVVRGNTHADTRRAR
jgi:hypothetical protein